MHLVLFSRLDRNIIIKYGHGRRGEVIYDAFRWYLAAEFRIVNISYEEVFWHVIRNNSCIIYRDAHKYVIDQKVNVKSIILHAVAIS